MAQVIRFDGDEEGYLQWMVDHPAGFVLNTKRDEGAAMAMLHRAGCAHIRVIRNQEASGAFTQRGGIKLCSLEIRDLLAALSRMRSGLLLRVVSCRSCGALPMDVEVLPSVKPSLVDRGAEWERDPMLRAFCFQYHGTRCKVCQVDLAQRFGALGSSTTEVHLVRPQAFSDAATIPDPMKDLVPICPTCHVMLHLGRVDPLPIEDLRRRMTWERIAWRD